MKVWYEGNEIDIDISEWEFEDLDRYYQTADEFYSGLHKYDADTSELSREEKHQKAIENVGDGKTPNNGVFSSSWYKRDGEPVASWKRNDYVVEYKFGNRSDGRFPYRMFHDSPVPSKKNTKVITVTEFENWVLRNPDCSDWEYYQHLPNCGCNWDSYEHSRKGERVGESVGKNREKSDTKDRQYIIIKRNVGSKKTPRYEVQKLPYGIAKQMYGKNVSRYIVEWLDEWCDYEIGF